VPTRSSGIRLHPSSPTGDGPRDVVTGAYGYTGRYLAAQLLDAGRHVRTLTGDPSRPDPFGGRVEAFPFTFDDPPRLVETLRGADTLYNTYWVRFPWRTTSYEQAVANTRTLLAAAREAGVRRVVHVSITNARESSPLPYFHWKGVLERELRDSGLGYAIVRPTVVFGLEDILVNNIAWLLRRLPAFVVAGTGDYRVQPVYVEDLAALCAELGRRDDDAEIDAVGPETWSFDALVRIVRRAVGSRALVVYAPSRVTLLLGDAVGRLVRDVVLTRDEVAGLMASLLVSGDPPTATTSFRAWVTEHADELGRRYASELARHYRR
jgi:NADH dehydrogenase